MVCSIRWSGYAQFGQVFGNTVYSASIVVAIFMLGLGVGSYVFGVLGGPPVCGLAPGAVCSPLRRARSAHRGLGVLVCRFCCRIVGGVVRGVGL